MNKSVLIIEDDERACKLLCEMLQRRGIHAECAYTFDEGLACVTGDGFDLAIVDLSLPPLHDPHATFARLPELGTAVIILTGVEDPALIRECQKRRINFILKPIVTEEVLKLVLTELEWTAPSLELEHALLDSRKDVIGSEAKKNVIFERRITLGNVLQIMSFFGLIAAAFLSAQSQFTELKMRVGYLEKRDEEKTQLMQKVSASLDNAVANQGKIAGTLELIEQNFQYGPKPIK